MLGFEGAEAGRGGGGQMSSLSASHSQMAFPHSLTLNAQPKTQNLTTHKHKSQQLTNTNDIKPQTTNSTNSHHNKQQIKIDPQSTMHFSFSCSVVTAKIG